MFNITKKEIQWGGRTLSLETGEIARQANGSVVVSYGKTKVLATTVVSKEAKNDLDFFPLTVHYQEKYYSARKIPGGFMKREAKPRDHEVLISRLIDRPIRPLFPSNFRNEVQIIVQSLTYDPDAPIDVVAIIAASASAALAGLPLEGTLAGAKIGLLDGDFLLNPSAQQVKDGELEIVVGATKQGVLMVESEAKQLSEEVMLEAIAIAHEQMEPVINLINDLVSEAGAPAIAAPAVDENQQALCDAVKDFTSGALVEAYKRAGKQERNDAINAIETECLAFLETKGFDTELVEKKFSSAFKDAKKDIVRGNILKTGVRIDGRDTDTVRPINAQAGKFEGLHGNALFTRGETQVLSVVTLGSKEDAQMIDGLDETSYERFMLHYNFPSYSVGEVAPLRGPGRREIGHGKLAWRAINPLLPSPEEFIYAIRAVAEVTESNGSSSMATVCATSMALMDAGVPIEPVSGVAMGLIKEGDEFAVLTDILGDEDSLGDMDFKVAGTKAGITSLQMDIKVTSITQEIMKVALQKAKVARASIMEHMDRAIPSHNSISSLAPSYVNMSIPVASIKDVIGSGGKIIKGICESYSVKVSIEDDGSVAIFGSDAAKVESAKEYIISLTSEPELDKTYDGKVVKVLDFGAFVSFAGNKEGLVHVSEIAEERVEDINNYLKEGDLVRVKYLGTNKGKTKLSIKKADKES